MTPPRTPSTPPFLVTLTYPTCTCATLELSAPPEATAEANPIPAQEAFRGDTQASVVPGSVRGMVWTAPPKKASGARSTRAGGGRHMSFEDRVALVEGSSWWTFILVTGVNCVRR